MTAAEKTEFTIVRQPTPSETAAARRWPWTAFASFAVVLLGIALRLWLPVGYHGMGYDEGLYRAYVLSLDAGGLENYDTVTEAYLTDQRRPETLCKLPPTRFLYVFSAWLVKQVEFGEAPPLDLKQAGNAARDPALYSLRLVSRLGSIFLLLLSWPMLRRMLGKEAGLIALALLAAAPLQLHMAEHALIDGYFAFWAMLAVWSLWENLQKPRRTGWLIVYGVALAAMVMTKENSFFVMVGIVGILCVNRWARFGQATPTLQLVTVVGPLAGVAALARLAGGMRNLFATYHLLTTKAEHLDYAIQTGDGPWQRYLIDELTVSPIVFCLAIAAIFTLTRRRTALLYLGCFVAASYLVMCQVRNGMNFRYTTIWDLPLRALAAAQLAELNFVPRRWKERALIGVVAVICAAEIWQYWRLFVWGGLYETPTEDLLRALQVIKS